MLGSENPHSRIVLLLLVMVVLASLASCQPAPGKPNILLVVLDDFGFNDLALNNGSESPTPTLDEIAQRGVRFTRHYAESSCTPSRVALLTGLYPARAGAHPNVNGIDHELVTLPDVLRAHGYTNYMIGKWHAGDAHREARPEYQGFDHWFGFMSQLYLKGPHQPPAYTRGRPTYLDPWLEDESGDLRQREGHLTDLITDRAIEVIAQEENSWFMYLSYYAPHTPIQPARRFQADFPSTPAGKYQALKAQLDTNLGRLLEYLEEAGKLQDTMIVVVSDNGGTAKNWPSNLPFYGRKATYTEGGVRTPLLMVWPAHWPAGDTVDQAAMIFDIYPTILSALGLPVPEGLDGVDLFAPRQDRELRWYSHNGEWDTFGMLSADGKWRLSTWLKVSEYLYTEDDVVAEEHVGSQLDNPEVASSMRESMLDWIPVVTRVDQLDRVEEEGWSSYSGAAFRRTPIGGAHTMGFVFRRGAQQGAEDARQLLVSQQGYIEISEVGGILQIRVDGNEVEVALPPGEECFSLLVSSSMFKTNMVFYKEEYQSRTRVHLNGEQQVMSTYSNPELNQASPRNPLRVRNAPASRWYMPPDGDVFLSTRWLGEEEIITVVEPELKVACSGQIIQDDK